METISNFSSFLFPFLFLFFFLTQKSRAKRIKSGRKLSPPVLSQDSTDDHFRVGPSTIGACNCDRHDRDIPIGKVIGVINMKQLTPVCRTSVRRCDARGTHPMETIRAHIVYVCTEAPSRVYPSRLRLRSLQYPVTGHLSTSPLHFAKPRFRCAS